LTSIAFTDAQVIQKRCIPISGEDGICRARTALREMLDYAEINNEIWRAQLLTIIDELGKNILRHGAAGRLCISMVQVAGRIGFRITAEDRGRGITDLDQAFTPGYSEDKGMGMGLNLLKALSDDIRIANFLSGGALIEIWKWI